jgi:hypothetical protein
MKSATKTQKTAPPSPEAEREAASTKYATSAAALAAAADELPDGKREPALREALAAARAALAFVTPFDAMCLRAVLAAYETDSKATVENREETAYKPDMDQSPDIGGATPEQAQTLLGQVIGKIGFAAVAKMIVEAASPDDRALLAGMVARGRELTGREAPPRLSAADLAAFMAHAASHQWNRESKPKVAPSAFIAETFKDWLGRGLMLKHIRAAQKNLAGAYSMEVNRAPSKRVAGLIVIQEKLPVGAPRPPSSRPIAELSEAEKAERRRREAANTRRYRLKQRQQDLTIA